MFKPIKAPIKAYENVTYQKALRFRDTNKNIISLAGYTARLEVRSSAEEASTVTPKLVLTTENGGLTIDADLGKIVILVEVPVLAYEGVYDIFLYKDSKTYYPILPSPFKVVSTVTETP